MIAAVIPAWNEEKNISEAVKRTKKFVDEVIVVDDGSKDRTYEFAKKAGAIVLRHKTNMGKGAGLKTAVNYLKNKKYEYIILIDADLQFYPEDAPKLIKKLEEGYDFVMGSRDFSKVPFRHRLGNFVWKTAFNILFGTKLKDTNSGFVAFRKSVLNKLEFGGGYMVETTMLSSMARNNLKLTNAPVRVEYHRTSKIGRGIRMVFGVLIKIISEGIKYRLGL